MDVSKDYYATIGVSVFDEDYIGTGCIQGFVNLRFHPEVYKGADAHEIMVAINEACWAILPISSLNTTVETKLIDFCAMTCHVSKVLWQQVYGAHFDGAENVIDRSYQSFTILPNNSSIFFPWEGGIPTLAARGGCGRFVAYDWSRN